MPTWTGIPGTGDLILTNNLYLNGPSPHVDVRAKGATGDGVTDDRAVLASADAAATASGTVRFSSGTYRVRSDLTFAATVVFGSGALVKPDTGVIVRFANVVHAGSNQIVASTGGNGFAQDITGLNVWYFADEFLGNADGSAIASWTDNSGNGNTATQGTANKQPLYKPNILNGHGSLRFDVTNDTLATAVFGTPIAQPNTVVVIAKLRTLTGADQIFIDGAGAGRQIVRKRSAGAGNWGLFAGNTVNTTTLGDLNAHIHTIVFNAASTIYRLDGSVKSIANPGSQALNGLTVGALVDAEIFEVLVYNRALTTAEMQGLEGFYGTKYGIVVG